MLERMQENWNIGGPKKLKLMSSYKKLGLGDVHGLGGRLLQEAIF